MSWDTKYRPVTYGDVLGQEATISILRQIVKSKRGFHQSYLFSGPFGTGKTTLGRILARALLCSEPQDGNPCDQCPSCKELLRKGSSECFSEMDAATNSGKESIRRILETIEFGTFSGVQRIYLVDESHQLSRDALDALLKPLEDTRGDTGNRKLVCIFCTTEPEKMRETIGSRCGPTFAVHIVPPEKTVERLEWVCIQEGVPFERSALVRVAESVEGHIRDAFKACEMLSMQGGVTLSNVAHYLGQDLSRLYLDIFEGMQGEVQTALTSLDQLLVRVSPAVIYEKLARVALLSYKLGLGIGKAPSYWDDDRLRNIGRGYGDTLLDLAEMFGSRPRRPTKDMLQCDLFSVHCRLRGGIQLEYANLSPLDPTARVVLSQQETIRAQAQGQVQASTPVRKPVPVQTSVAPPTPSVALTIRKPSYLPTPTDPGNNYLTPNGVSVPPWGMSKSRLEAIQRLQEGGGEVPEKVETSSSVEDFSSLTSQSFSLLVSLHASELTGKLSKLEAEQFCSLVSAHSSELNKVVVHSGEEQKSGSKETDG